MCFLIFHPPNEENGMASALCTALLGITIEELHQTVSGLGRRINMHRERRRLHKFPAVYVSDILIDPRDRSLSFLVQFSDSDKQTEREVCKVLRRLEKLRQNRLLRLVEINRQWFSWRGDFYLA